MDLDLIDVDSADITMGHYVIGHVPPATLQNALTSWDQGAYAPKGTNERGSYRTLRAMRQAFSCRADGS